MKEVGKRLKALREGVGVSQVKLAEALGSTQSSINRHEIAVFINTILMCFISLDLRLVLWR